MGGYSQRQATVHYSDQTSMGLLHPQDYLGGGSGEGGGAASSQSTFWTTIPPTQQTTTPQLNSVSEVKYNLSLQIKYTDSIANYLPIKLRSEGSIEKARQFQNLESFQKRSCETPKWGVS